MQEKIIVTPSEVRGLGNVVFPKSSSDFNEYLSKVTSDSEEIDGITKTVYTLEYDSTTLLLTVNKSHIQPGGTVTVTVTVTDDNGDPIENAEIDLYKVVD